MKSGLGPMKGMWAEIGYREKASISSFRFNSPERINTDENDNERNFEN